MRKSSLERLFMLMWDGPELTPEYRFHPTRRWRFDFAHTGSMVAVELEGGTYMAKSRHTSPLGFERDAEKYNAATALGWRVFRLTSKMITAANVAMIKEAIG